MSRNGLAESSLVDGYTTVDATFMITGADENWDVSLIARNLTDEREATLSTTLRSSHQLSTRSSFRRVHWLYRRNIVSK